MQKPRIYLETSIWNFYFAEDSAFKRDATKDFFLNLAQDYEVFTAEIVLQEIGKAEAGHQQQLLKLIGETRPAFLTETAETDEISKAYLSELALPPRSTIDARHAAIATFHEMDILLSWNLKHLANYNRMQKINAVNRKMGYRKELYLLTPLEVSNER